MARKFKYFLGAIKLVFLLEDGVPAFHYNLFCIRKKGFSLQSGLEVSLFLLLKKFRAI
jgi:hypothetical protein